MIEEELFWRRKWYCTECGKYEYFEMNVPHRSIAALVYDTFGLLKSGALLAGNNQPSVEK